MARYRSKPVEPVEIEAFQMTRKRMGDCRDWPEWLNEALKQHEEQPSNVWVEKGAMFIRDAWRTMRVSENDWILLGQQGTLHVWEPDDFEAMYEPVEQPAGFLGPMDRAAVF